MLENRAAQKRKRDAPSPKAQKLAFISERVWKVREARQRLHKQVEPKALPSIAADEQSQLVLQFNWDDVSRILQEESTLSEGKVPAIQWSALKEATDENVHRQFPEVDCDVLLLMKREELSNPQWPSKLLLFKVKARRIDILIEVKKDTPLLPAAADIKQNIPFPVRRYANYPAL